MNCSREGRTYPFGLSKRPFGSPLVVRCAHCVLIANDRLIACDAGSVTFKWKDCRIGRP